MKYHKLRQVYEIGEELVINGLKCECVEVHYNSVDDFCKAHGQLCIFGGDTNKCFRYACLPSERPDGKSVVYIIK